MPQYMEHSDCCVTQIATAGMASTPTMAALMAAAERILALHGCADFWDFEWVRRVRIYACKAWTRKKVFTLVIFECPDVL